MSGTKPHNIPAAPLRAAGWLALLCAIAVTILALRYQESPSADCVALPEQLRASEPPLATAAPAVARYVFRFDSPTDSGRALALTVGRALPFYRLLLNGADLTPDVDLNRRDFRDIAPHLHILPVELLRDVDNVVQLQVPQDATLGPSAVEHVCVGPRAKLESAFRVNWWRMVGIPRACLMLFVALALLATALWFIGGLSTSYPWYIACLLPMIVRSLYLSTAVRPGGPRLWIWIDDLSLLLLPIALYRFMHSLWRFHAPHLRAFVQLSVCASGLCLAIRALFPSARSDALLSGGFVLIIICSSMAVAATVMHRAQSMHRIERRVLIGICSFAFFVALLEALNFSEHFAQRWMWTSPPATLVLAMGLGYLLIRRMAIGDYVLTAAADTLAGDLDQALAAPSMRPQHLWKQVADGVSLRERKRLIRDIHDGFGSRLVGVLARARRELEDPSLQQQIQRALVDMRLMLDALDDSSRSLDSAIARFRHRIEQAHPDAAQRCEWRTDLLDDVVIGDRNRLIAVFRSLEELLSDRFEHDETDELLIEVQTSRRKARFVITGGSGEWRAPTIDRVHRMIRAAGGAFALHGGVGTHPARAAFSVPLF